MIANDATFSIWGKQITNGDTRDVLKNYVKPNIWFLKKIWSKNNKISDLNGGPCAFKMEFKLT
jgi:hypothetical protein